MVRDMRGMRGIVFFFFGGGGGGGVFFLVCVVCLMKMVRDMRGMRGKSESRQEVVRNNLPTEPFWRAAFPASFVHVAGK